MSTRPASSLRLAQVGLLFKALAAYQASVVAVSQVFESFADIPLAKASHRYKPHVNEGGGRPSQGGYLAERFLEAISITISLHLSLGFLARWEGRSVVVHRVESPLATLGSQSTDSIPAC